MEPHSERDGRLLVLAVQEPHTGITAFDGDICSRVQWCFQDRVYNMLAKKQTSFVSYALPFFTFMLAGWYGLATVLQSKQDLRVSTVVAQGWSG